MVDMVSPCVPRTSPANVDVAVVFNLEANSPLVIDVVAEPVTVKVPVERLVVVACVPVAFMNVKF